MFALIFLCRTISVIVSSVIFARCLPFVQNFYQNQAVFCISRTPHKMDIFRKKSKKRAKGQIFLDFSPSLCYYIYQQLTSKYKQRGILEIVCSVNPAISGKSPILPQVSGFLYFSRTPFFRCFFQFSAFRFMSVSVLL